MASRPTRPSAVYKEDKERTRSGVTSIVLLLVGALMAIVLMALAYFSPFFDSFRASQESAAPDEAAVEPIKDPTAPIEYEFYEVLPEQEFRSVPEGVSVQESATSQSATLSPDAVVTAKPVAKPKADAPTDAGTANKADKADKTNNTDDSVSITEESTTYDEPANSASADTTTDAKAGTTYILQIRSYTTADEADVKRAEVLMAGVDAVVVKRTDSAKGTHFYQVVSTPMKSREEASQASARLSNNGIDSLIVEQKR